MAVDAMESKTVPARSVVISSTVGTNRRAISPASESQRCLHVGARRAPFDEAIQAPILVERRSSHKRKKPRTDTSRRKQNIGDIDARARMARRLAQWQCRPTKRMKSKKKNRGNANLENAIHEQGPRTESKYQSTPPSCLVLAHPTIQTLVC